AMTPSPTPVPEETPIVRIIEEKTQIIPFWAYRTIEYLENDREYKDRYAFLVERNGPDLQELIQWSKRLPDEESTLTMIHERAIKGLEAAIEQRAHDDSFLDRYRRIFRAELEKADFWGIRRVDDYWLCREYRKPDKTFIKKEYECIVFLAVPKVSVDKAIGKIFEDLSGSAAGEDKTSLEWLKTEYRF
ncbi:MAG: hypothetical protein JW969_14535, partial [Spirochaetales bacterium]|nr:hypothetical protein [Spirochaetales bacterium]